MPFKRVVSAVVLCGLVMAAGGCLVMKGKSVQETGVRVSQSTLAQITPGETTQAWLLAVLGEPTSARDVDDRTRILRYDHKVTTEKGGTVFLIFAGGESYQNASTALFEVTDGVVTRYWTES